MEAVIENQKAPSYAVIFMGGLEEQIITMFVKLLIWWRDIDDNMFKENLQVFRGFELLLSWDHNHFKILERKNRISGRSSN